MGQPARWLWTLPAPAGSHTLGKRCARSGLAWPTPGRGVLAAGDANRDGRFTSSDLVQVFQWGEYEDEIKHNSSWEEGDWNGDGDFTTSDMVMAFQTGLYELPEQANASRIAAAVDWLFAQEQRAIRQGRHRTA